MLRLDAGEPLAAAVTAAIQSGNVDELERLLAEHPELATARIVRRGRCGEQARSLLHIATDYPGHFPNAEYTKGFVYSPVRLANYQRAEHPSAMRVYDGETRTRTGDTTIFSRALVSLKFGQFAGNSSRSSRLR
jgi:hypothetical protein